MVLSELTEPRGRPGRPDVEVAVVGAGPHGLSAAVHLRRAGAEVRVLGRPMSFWQTMPTGMLLRSNLSATNMIETEGPLSLLSYMRETGARIEPPVPLEDFVAYGRWVQRQAVPDVDERLVARVSRRGPDFALELEDGSELSAGRVVLACGIAPFQRSAPGFEHLSPDRASHSAEHRDPSRFAGRRVAVVGGGQSAFELATLIHEAGAEQVEVLVRADRVVWLRGHSVKKAIGRLGPIVYAPTDVGPLWYSRLVERPPLFGRLPRETQNRIAARCIRPACSHFVRARLDRVRTSVSVTVTEARERGDVVELALSDGTRREVDHVILATGYQVDIRRYAFLDPGLLAGIRQTGGSPVLRRGLETSVPGLHIMGAPAAWSFGPIMRFVSGSWYGGRAVAAAHRSGRALTRR